MKLEQKRTILIVLSLLFLLSLIFVQKLEVARRYQEVGLAAKSIAVPASSRQCVDCHRQGTPGIIDHWKGSQHADQGVGCADCHQAKKGDADAFDHYGHLIATVVTPRDCGRCHPGRDQGIRSQPPRRRRQHPGVARQFPGRTGGRRASALRAPFADPGPAARGGQRQGQLLFGLPAVPRLEGRACSARTAARSRSTT